MGSVVLITGTGSGLGSCLAETFQARSWKVLRGDRVCKKETSERFELDVTNRNAASKKIEDLGRIDVLINNAGITEDNLLTRASVEEWEKIINANLTGAAWCSRAAYKLMKKNGGGQIINVGSWSGTAGAAGQAIYAASKAGLIGLTKALAQEGGRYNIRCNIVLPGVLTTRMTAGLNLESFKNANVLGRINDLPEVAEFFVHLAGMKNVSGQVFQLDSRIGSWT